MDPRKAGAKRTGSLRDVGDAHAGLLQAVAVLLHPQEEGGHGTLRRVGVLKATILDR